MLPFSTENLPAEPGVYLVGGSVRDLLLDRAPLDCDIAVAGDAQRFARRLASAENGRLVTLGSKDQIVYRIVKGERIFDVTPLAGPTIEADLSQRDFTINALAWDVAGQRLIDPFDGRADLDARTVRMVSPAAFLSDPLRLLRAHRLAATLAFDIEPRTAGCIRAAAGHITEAAAERILLELDRLLETPGSYAQLTRLADNGLLFAILPELGVLTGCQQNRYHRFDAWQHTLAAYTHLETLLAALGEQFPSIGNRLAKHLSPPRPLRLKWAVLLHDIGKPATRSIDDAGDAHFYGHPQQGANMAGGICKRLKFSTRAGAYIDFVIRRHLRPLELFTAHTSRRLSARGRTRFFMQCGDLTPDLLLHSMADITAKGAAGDPRDAAFLSFARETLGAYFQDFLGAAALPPLLTGHDLITHFGLAPSPLFKTILTAVRESQLDGCLADRAAGLELAARLIGRNG